MRARQRVARVHLHHAHLSEYFVVGAATSLFLLPGARLLGLATSPDPLDEQLHRLDALFVDDSLQLQRQEAQHLGQRFGVERRQQLVDPALLRARATSSPVVYWGVYAGIRRIPTYGVF